MSGLYLGTENREIASESARQLSFTRDTSAVIGQSGNLHFAVTRVDSLDLWGPARDPVTGIQVFLGGRVSFEESDWKRGENLPYTGGAACQLILHFWLTNKKLLISNLNGAFCVVIIEPQEKKLHLITDRLGIYPIYHSTGDTFYICSHSDVLASALHRQGKPCDLDLTTFAECLGTASATQPFTYYKQIQQLQPATQYVWDLELDVPRIVQQQEYWQPAYLNSEPSHDAISLAEELAQAIRNASRRRTNPRFGKAVLFLSGGADSRAILFGASDPSKIDCYTLYDEENEELAAARKLARIAGANHKALQRSPEYYGENAETAVQVSGGIWSIVDAHFVGVRSKIEKPGVVLTGCYADYMFKGLSFNRKHRTFAGRNLPLYDLSSFDFQFYHRHTRLSEGWQKRVANRLRERFATVRNRDLNDPLAVEDLRIRPFSREADACGRLTQMRLFPWEPFFADNEILAVYGKISAALKLNGAVFGDAVGRVIGPAALKIHNNNYGTPVNASEWERIVWFLSSVLKRKVNNAIRVKRTNEKLATVGSWPNWAYYVSHSERLATLWGNPSKSEREFFRNMLGRDPWQMSLKQWATEDTLLIARLITMRTWLKQKRFF